MDLLGVVSFTLSLCLPVSLSVSVCVRACLSVVSLALSVWLRLCTCWKMKHEFFFLPTLIISFAFACLDVTSEPTCKRTYVLGEGAEVHEPTRKCLLSECSNPSQQHQAATAAAAAAHPSHLCFCLLPWFFSFFLGLECLVNATQPRPCAPTQQNNARPRKAKFNGQANALGICGLGLGLGLFVWFVVLFVWLANQEVFCAQCGVCQNADQKFALTFLNHVPCRWSRSRPITILL